MNYKKILLLLVVLVAAVGFPAAFVGYQFYQDQIYQPTVALPVQRQLTEVGEVRVESVATEVGQLWGIDFIPGTALLVATQRQGQLFVIDTESQAVTEITGVPAVVTHGQGGLLDVAVSPEFAADQTIFLTYATAGSVGSATRLASARLDLEANTLQDMTVLYTAPFQSGGSHFGSRVVVAGEYLFVTLGDRGDKNFANHVSQNTQNPYGSVLRLRRDGQIPVDNPFVRDDAVLDEIYSFGHRNPQGLVLRPGTNELWLSDHGEFDGDEINIVQAGGNFGWPIAHTACGYVTRRPFGELPWERDDTINPIHYWECGTGGFPPAGMTFYVGETFAPWQGDLFVGGLASRYLAHFRVTETGLVEQAPLLKEEGWRVRDVTVGPHDGALYAAVEGSNVPLVRIVPVQRIPHK